MSKRISRAYTFHFRQADNGDAHDQAIIDKLDEEARRRNMAQYVREAIREKIEREE